jgi:hypothetical protein
MSRNGSGTYSLPSGNPVVTATTITSTWANTTLGDIANALTGSLAADGQTPATGNLNMNTNQIKNVVDPTLAQDAATKAYVDATSFTVAPGTAGNVLTSNGTIWTSASPASGPIPSGTVMLFYQAAAPTGWTQVTTQNNKALRVVSGTGAGTGGSVAFTTAFASQAVSGSVGTSGATTLGTGEMPSHTHPSAYYTAVGGCFSTTGYGNISVGPSGVGGTPSPTGSTGGGGSHTHTGGTFTGTAINLAVQYIDIILASKN